MFNNMVLDEQSCIFRANYLQKYEIYKFFDARFGFYSKK